MVIELPPCDAAADPVRISFRPGSTTLADGDTYVFDAAGRLMTASRGERFYKRGLSHRVLEKRRAPARMRHGWHYRDLDAAEKNALIEAALAAAGRVQARLPASAPAGLRERLAALLRWTPAAYAEEARRFQAVYRPVGILPPDQYLSVVLQATEGCHYNRCTFCTFYRDVPFHVKDEAAFRAHIAAVRDLLGDGLSLRRTLFLADANALVVSQRRLVALFRVLNEAFRLAPPGLTERDRAAWAAAEPGRMEGVYAFLDVFSGKPKTGDEFAELAALGLRRVYIGMESGHVPLLAFLEKPSLPDAVQATVEAAHAGGVNVGVIVMTGIGGNRYAAAHVADTAAVLARLDLSSGDLIYFSEFVEAPASVYAERARAAGIQALSAEEQAAQAAAIRRALPPGIRTAAYAIREFIY